MGGIYSTRLRGDSSRPLYQSPALLRGIRQILDDARGHLVPRGYIMYILLLKKQERIKREIISTTHSTLPFSCWTEYVQRYIRKEAQDQWNNLLEPGHQPEAVPVSSAQARGKNSNPPRTFQLPLIGSLEGS